MAMSEQWYVLSEGQQLGPYSGEELVQFAQEGRIAAETMVWADGMAEWVQATQVPGLIATAPVVAKPAAAPAWAPPGARVATAAAPVSASPYATPASSMVTAAPTGGNYPFVSIKPASFGLWMWTFLIGFIGYILMIVLMIKGGIDAGETMQADPNATPTMPNGVVVGMIVGGIGMLCLLLSTIFFYINIYRAWSCLRAGAPRTTPGMAIGMLFIPFYNIYWIFVAIAGLPKDWNRIVASYEDLQTAPRLSESVFLMFCIGTLVFPPLSLVMIFMMTSQLCKGINFFAYRRNPSAPGATGTAGFGGVRFG